jgi:putative acetyltransferase
MPRFLMITNSALRPITLCLVSDARRMNDVIRIARTNCDDPRFRDLESLLNAEMSERYGELQKWYDQFNIIKSNATVVVAYAGDLPIGCGCLREFGEEAAEIKRMFVKPGFRGTGIAEKILLELEKWASELGYSVTVLETAIKQPEAIRFYTRLGYKRIENYGQYAGNDNSICMSKRLRFP